MSNKHPIVNTPLGQLAGTYEKGNIAVFKGVPYAKPPVGPLRWRPPQPLEPWQGIKQATDYGPTAMQRSGEIATLIDTIIDGQGMGILKRGFLKAVMRVVKLPPQSEDCLTLNVRTPSVNGRLPVMVWIHGGAHQNGSNREPFYEGNDLPKQDVVTVTINYRVGLMGYFAHPKLSEESEQGVSGNYGTLDQIAALQWVQDNITAFGGDPTNVTIFGQSAGGESVLHMMTSPLARGLFHKAIAQSPATVGQLVYLQASNHVYEAAETSGEKFAQLTGANSLDELRTMSAEDLQAIVNANTGALGNFSPVIDGYVLPVGPYQAFRDGSQAKVPLIIGSNADECTVFSRMFAGPLMEYAETPITSELPAYMQDEFGDDLAALLQLYPGLDRMEQQAILAHQGDALFGSAVRHYAGELANDGSTVYVYLFKRVPPSLMQTSGAFHAAELPFVHGTSTPLIPMNHQDKVLSRTMIGYWTRFAKTGDPNNGQSADWEQFDPNNPRWMTFDRDAVQMAEVDREEEYQIFLRRLRRVLASTPAAQQHTL